MQTVTDAANFVGDKVNELTSAASKEGNKEVAKGNTDASLGNRASAAVDAAGDKMDESKSEASAELNKEKAKN